MLCDFKTKQMKQIIILLVFVSLVNVLSAQTNKWRLNREEVYNSEQTAVHTCFPKVTNNAGEEEVVFNWKLSSIQQADFDRCVKTIKNTVLHKKIYDCKTSELVNQTDDSTKVVYYLFKTPWPMPDTDLVRTISERFENDNQVFISKHVSTPGAYQEMGKKRLQVSAIHFKLEKISETEIRFELQGEFIPVGVPVALAKTWFPKGPVKIVENIVDLSK